MQMLFAEMTPGTLAVLAVVGLMTCMLLVRTQKQMKSSHSHAPAKPPAPAREVARSEMQATRRLDQWEVRMHDLARDLTARLDSKMVALELLVREAQEQIVRLERATQDAPQPPSAASGESQRSDPASTTQVNTQAAALPRWTQRPHVPPSARGASRRHREIYALADAGHSHAAIAEQLGSPIGEVELILGLRRDQPADS
jgi:hypothetical protein